MGNNSSNNFRPRRLLSDHKGMLKLPCLEMDEFNFSLQQDHPFLLDKRIKNNKLNSTKWGLTQKIGPGFSFQMQIFTLKYVYKS